MKVYIVGRFPPPIDGQTMATQRLAELLEQFGTVTRLNTEPPSSVFVSERERLKVRRMKHFLRLRGLLRDALHEDPNAVVLWPAISPAPLGHLRDLLSTMPAFHPRQAIYAVVHRGNFDRVFRTLPWSLSAKRLVSRLSGFVFLNEQLADHCARWIPSSKRFVIPNTIDRDLVCTDNEVLEKCRTPRTPFRLLFLSNMIASKGYLDVLLAVQLLRSRGLEVQADFAGRWAADDDRIRFEALVSSNDLAGVVTHHGGVSDRGMIKELHLKAHVFLLPTYYPTEAQPVSIIEALNAGTPVVTTRHAGIPEMVREDREGFFVSPRDPDAIANAIRHLMEGATWERLSEMARQRFLDDFSPESVQGQWVELLEIEASAFRRAHSYPSV